MDSSPPPAIFVLQFEFSTMGSSSSSDCLLNSIWSHLHFLFSVSLSWPAIRPNGIITDLVANIYISARVLAEPEHFGLVRSLCIFTVWWASPEPFWVKSTSEQIKKKVLSFEAQIETFNQDQVMQMIWSRKRSSTVFSTPDLTITMHIIPVSEFSLPNSASSIKSLLKTHNYLMAWWYMLFKLFNLVL